MNKSHGGKGIPARHPFFLREFRLIYCPRFGGIFTAIRNPTVKPLRGVPPVSPPNVAGEPYRGRRGAMSVRQGWG